MTPYGNIDLGQYCPRKWFDAWRHQAITLTHVDSSSVRSGCTRQKAISQETPEPLITKIILKNTKLIFHSNPMWDNALRRFI